MSGTATAPSTATPSATGGVRVRVQKFGTFLSNMVMPNIGAFIAWGLITALFIERGWITGIFAGARAEDSWVAAIGGWGEFEGGGIVGPMITYLLPLLIGYTGGRMVHGVRGGVVGAIATMGVIAGTDMPMFMGAMIMGPLGGWTMKVLDNLWEGRIRPGFEMLVNNFSAGIWGALLATFGFFVMSRVVSFVAGIMENGVDFLVRLNLLPLTSIVIEPAKVLFLNNAINHGVLTPLGGNQLAEHGQSVLFLLEANPGPGLGLLLAFALFGRGLARASAPGAALIHFVGGIHEIYFPYVLMKPKLIVAMIAGGMTQIFINVLFGSGLRGPAAPGSIIAVLLQTPAGSLIGVLLSVVAGAGVTFLIAAVLLKTDKADDDGDLSAATANMEQMKGKKSSVAGALTGGAVATKTIRSIVFACDAGMGSSAMGASVLRRKVQGAGFTEVSVRNEAIANLTDDVDLVVTHQDLTDRAKQSSPSAIHVSVDNFMGSPRYDEIVALLGRTNRDEGADGEATDGVEGRDGEAADEEEGATDEALIAQSIVLTGSATTREDAITEAGRLLLQRDAVEPAYVDAMLEREQSVSTHMGNGLAIPHGTNEAKSAIKHTALSFVRYPEAIDWGGNPVTFVVGIAGAGDDHLTVLRKIGLVFTDQEKVDRLHAATTAQDVLDVLDG